MSGSSDPFRSWRLNRRRLLEAGVITGGGLAAAALVGCGDDDDDEPAASQQPSQQQQPAQQPVVKAKPGGTMRLNGSASPLNLDPMVTADSNQKNAIDGVYGSIFVQVGTTFDKVPNTEMAGELAKTWEFTPDGLTLTIKLHPTAKFHPPLSRKVTAEDIVASYNRFTGKITGKAAAPAAGQFSFVDNTNAVDAETVVVKLKQPFYSTLWRLADSYNMMVLPKEMIDGSINPSEKVIGSGPWMWESWEPSVNHRLKRNPEWHLGNKERPYLDGVTITVIPQPANQLVQFKSKNLDQINTVSPDELINLKRDRPDAVIEPRKSLGWGIMAFGDPRTTAPWKDDRVRKALSLAFDRAQMTAAVYNTKTLDDAGFGISKLISWHNMLPAGYAGVSIDPRQDAANTGKWIKYDVAEAKKLLDAAGFKDGFSAPYHYTTIYGAAWKLEAEIIPQLVNQIGVKLQTTIDDFASVYQPKTFGRGEFDGIAFLLQAYPDVGDYLTDLYTPAGRNHSKVNDPALVKKIDEIGATMNVQQRSEKLRAIQTDLVNAMWYVPGVAWQTNWLAFDPGVKKPNEAHGNGRGGDPRWSWPNWWLDK